MPICAKCNTSFPNDIYENGKRITLHKRKYCLQCVPIGDLSTGLFLHYGTKPIEIGKEYGQLTVLDEVGSPYPNAKRDTRRYYRCLCNCGNELIRPADVLRNTKNGCGCFETNKRKKIVSKKACNYCNIVKDISEYTIGRYQRKNKDGILRDISYPMNACKSCIVSICQKNIETKAKYKFNTIKSNCIIRQIECELSLDEFQTYWDLPCHYCGGDRKTHGLDRVDNNGPYSIENCVPCCKDCNYMKKTMGYDDFLDKITKIYKNFNQDYI